MSLLKVLSESKHKKHERVCVLSIDLTPACAVQVNAKKDELLGEELARRLECKTGNIFTYTPQMLPSTIKAVSCTFVQSAELYLSAWLVISSIVNCEVVLCDMVMCETLANAFIMHTVNQRRTKAACWAAEIYRFDSFILDAGLAGHNDEKTKENLRVMADDTHATEAQAGTDRTLVVMDLREVHDKAKGAQILPEHKNNLVNWTTQHNIRHVTFLLLEYAQSYRLDQIARGRRKFTVQWEMDMEQAETNNPAKASVYTPDTNDVFGQYTVEVVLLYDIVEELGAACSGRRISIETFLIELATAFLVDSKLQPLAEAYPMAENAARLIEPFLRKYEMSTAVEGIIQSNERLCPNKSSFITFTAVQATNSRPRARACTERGKRRNNSSNNQNTPDSVLSMDDNDDDYVPNSTESSSGSDSGSDSQGTSKKRRARSNGRAKKRVRQGQESGTPAPTDTQVLYDIFGDDTPDSNLK